MNGMWLMIFWMALLGTIHCRPQSNQFDDPKQSVETEQQDILQLSTFNISMRDETSQRKIEENTKQILEKIEELNRKQGLVKKKKPTYFHFPFSYSKSQEPISKTPQQRSEHNFKFPSSPLENPILEYLNNQKDLPTKLKTSYSPLQNGSLAVVETNPTAEITKDDEVPGQYITRKVTHQQVMIVPSIQTYMNNQNNPAFQQYHQLMQNQQNFAMQAYPGYNTPNIAPPFFYPYSPSTDTDGNKKKPTKKEEKVENLESQTLNNIKNIIYNSQSPPNYVNPYIQNINPYFMNSYQQTSNKATNDVETNKALIYGPYVVPNLEAAQLRQIQIQSPLYDYFPIMIKDPIMHFFTALTTMVEYGPQAGSSTSTDCKSKDDSEHKLKANPEKTVDNITETNHADGVISDNQGNELKYDSENAENLNLQLENLTENGHISLEFENPNFQDDEDNIGRGFNIRFPKTESNVKEPRIEKSGSTSAIAKSPHYSMKSNKVDLGPQMVRVGTKTNQKSSSTTSRTVYIGNKAHLVDSPPNREHIPYDDETEEDKGLGFGNKPEDIQVSHDGNKKLFSKDNTGSGIFIHKLKVRKGGVAIAGPGGIATAGDGGTAIVGPNGYAYTQPDSLAIAGTGTKVIAVEPTINLSELLKGNKSRLVGANGQRIGKLVAVGPVIYYNKG